MSEKTLRASFDGGELSPELLGRLDLQKFQSGLQTCLNFITLPHGPAVNRPGFEYVAEVKDSSKAVRLLPFIFSPSQAYIMEFGDQYVRFHTEGATILEATQNITGATSASPVVLSIAAHGYSNGDDVYLADLPGDFAALNGRFFKAANVAAGTFELQDALGVDIDGSGFAAYTSGGTAARPVEVVTPYLEADLFDLVIAQAADTVTITHVGYAPRELVRLGATSWSLSTITFAPGISAPTGVEAAATVGTGTPRHEYVVTAVSETGLEESLASDTALGEQHAVTAVTQANPGVLTTATPHNLLVGDPVYVAGIGGMVELVDGFYRVNTVPGSSLLSLKRLDGTVVDTSGYTAYTSGGAIDHVFVANDLTTTGNYNTITGVNVAGAVRYNVYKARSGVFGYIGQVADLSVGFVDDNITPDMLSTPPINRDPFIGAGDYPGAVGYFAQRRVFAGTDNQPQTKWMSRPGTPSNFSYSIPTQDNDSISFALDARQVNQILHLVPLTDLLDLTNTGEWKVYSQNSDAITPTTVAARQQGYTGASARPPLVAGSTLLYVRAQGAHVAAMRYALESNAYDSADASVYAPHFFDGHTIEDWTYQRSPQPVAWAVRDDGVLLGMTYMPEQEIQAWHQHDTIGGAFESVCAIPESTNEDMVYAVVNRTVDGNTRRYVERMHVRRFDTVADAFFVDSGLTYDGVSTDTITGLHHLTGETVNALVDGNVVKDLTVVAGGVTLPYEGEKVQIGLPITADLKTLPVVMQVEALFQGQAKNINSVAMRVHSSRGIWAGFDEDHLTELAMRTSEVWGAPTNLATEEVDLTLLGDWNQDGAVLVRQEDPLPLSILSMVLEVAQGD